MSKRGLPGPEVVQREGDPVRLQPRHEGCHQFRHHHGRAFADFEDQPFPRRRAGLQPVGEHPRELRVADGACRHVHRQPQRRVARQCAKGHAQRAAVKLPPEFHRLHRRKEIPRRNDGAIGIGDADQPFVKGGRAGFPGLHHRLEGKENVPPPHRVLDKLDDVLPPLRHRGIQRAVMVRLENPFSSDPCACHLALRIRCWQPAREAIRSGKDG